VPANFTLDLTEYCRYPAPPMLQVDEVTSDWSVLLAMTRAETVRLLGIVLDGFGYRPLECHDNDSVYGHLTDTTPFAAVVDMRLDDADQICRMINERGGISLVILLGAETEDPESRVKEFSAEAWESTEAGPERILKILRNLANEIQTSSHPL